MIREIDELANLWEKTKDPRYKALWYQKIKEFADGSDNTKRWSIPSSSSDKRDDKGSKIIS